MAKIIIKCETCGKRKRVTKRHKCIIGKQCDDCLRIELKKESEQMFWEDLEN